MPQPLLPAMLVFMSVARPGVACGVGVWLLVLAGCAGRGPQVPTPAANPYADAATAPPRSVLGMDESTRKTQQLLAESGATRMEGLKPMTHDMSMGGMEHEGTKGMKGMPEKDHAKMPGMDHSDGSHGAHGGHNGSHPPSPGVQP